MKIVNRWICWLCTAWRTIQTGPGPIIDGCDYVMEQQNVPAYVDVMRCQVCGKYEVSWRPKT